MMTPSRPFLTLALSLAMAVFAALPGLSQQPPPALPGVPASWSPPPAQQGFWQRLDDRMRLSIPPQTETKAFAIASNDKIDPHAFTIDFWVAQYIDVGECNFTLEIGNVPKFEKTNLVILGEGLDNGEYLSLAFNPGSHYYLSGFNTGNCYDLLENCRGTIHWVRLTYDQEKEHMMVYVNGQCADWEGNVRFYGETPLALYFYPIGIHDDSHKYDRLVRQLDVLGIRVTNKYQPLPTSLPGIAYHGWSKLPAEPDPGCFPGGLEDHLQTLIEQPELTRAGRGAALASQVVVDRVSNGEIGFATWNNVCNFLGEESGYELAGKSLVLPVAIASGTDAQREELKPYVQRFFVPVIGKIGQGDHYNLDRRETVIDRAGTIDIGQTALALFTNQNGYSVPPELIDDAIAANPDLATGLEYMLITHEGWLQYMAWELPKFSACTPEFYQMVRMYLGERGLRGQGFYTDEPDRSLSFAAYQMAAIDPSLAVAYWDMMKNPQNRDEALNLITEGMPSAILPGEAAAKVEAGLKDAVARWKPEEGDSPIPQLYRLAHFYAGRGQQDEAVATVKEMVQKIGKEPDNRFRDVWLITLLAREMKLEEAQAWLDAALKLAATEEDGYFRRYSSLNSTNVLYPATSAEVLIDLAKQDKGDQVLTLARALGNDSLGRNSADKLATIVEALSEKDLRHAVEVWKLMPDDDRNPVKYETMTALGKQLLERDRTLAPELLRTLPPGPQLTAMVKAAAPEIAKTDLPGLLKMVQSVPDARRADMVRGIAEVMPIEGIPQLMKILNDWVAGRLGYYAGRPVEEKHYLVTQLSELPVSTIMALQPVCARNPEFYAELLLTGVMRAAELQNDPLWQRLTNAGCYAGRVLYGGATRLKDNVRDFDPAERFKKAVP